MPKNNSVSRRAARKTDADMRAEDRSKRSEREQGLHLDMRPGNSAKERDRLGLAHI